MLGKGRIARRRDLGEIRELEPEDLELLRGARPGPRLQRFKDSHHRVAILFASGMKMRGVQQATGYSMTRLSMLYNDPAFQELIASKRDHLEDGIAEQVDLYRQLIFENGIQAELIVADRLAEVHENSEAMNVRELLAISRDSADRSGYEKRQAVDINVGFADKLEKAISRSAKVLTLRPTPGPRALEAPAPTLSVVAAAAADEVIVEQEPLLRRRF